MDGCKQSNEWVVTQQYSLPISTTFIAVSHDIHGEQIKSQLMEIEWSGQRLSECMIESTTVYPKL